MSSIANLITSSIAGLSSLHGGLSGNAQNGGNPLGTPQAPSLPLCLGGSAPNVTQSTPWGGMTASNTNPYDTTPDTGVTRYYDLTVAPCTLAPDGVQIQNEICVNGQFPAPMIEANWGDWFEITVHNNWTEDGTALHWHGMLQQNTPWADGAPGPSMCPIAPGNSLTYRFQAQLYGTSWYHSHYSAQYAGALQGPMIIYGPSSAPYDIDIGPIMLTDWYHAEWKSLVDLVMTKPSEGGGPNAPVSNNNLINGKMNYDCSKTSLSCTPNAGLSRFTLTPGKWHRLRLINSGAQATQKFMIDGHQLKVIANDFVPVQPYMTDHVSLGIGQRSDVLVYGSGNWGDVYWMRSNIKDCSINDGISPVAYAVVQYGNVSESDIPQTNSDVRDADISTCANDPLSVTIPEYPMPVEQPATTSTIDITLGLNETGYQLYYMNNISFRANYNSPVLGDVHNGTLSFPSNSSVHNYGSNSTVRFIVYNYDSMAHPMHLHGHNMQILQVGFGQWDGSIVRPENPQRRDVQVLPPGGYIVIQWAQDNPGVWPFHCHIAWHLSAGFSMTLVERPDDIMKMDQIPAELDPNCETWDVYSGRVVVDEIDSGD